MKNELRVTQCKLFPYWCPNTTLKEFQCSRKHVHFFRSNGCCHRVQELGTSSVLNSEKRLSTKKRRILLTSIKNILKLDLNTISVNEESEMFSKFQLKLNENCTALIPIKRQHEGLNVTAAIFDWLLSIKNVINCLFKKLPYLMAARFLNALSKNWLLFLRIMKTIGA